MRKNIVLIGEIASGKTTIAKKLSEMYGYEVFSFATELKNIFKMIYKRDIDKSLDREKIQYLGQILKKNYQLFTDMDREHISFYIQSKEFFEYFMRNKNELFHLDFFANKLDLNINFHKAKIQNNAGIDDMRYIREQNIVFPHKNKNALNNVYYAYLDVDILTRYERVLKRDYQNCIDKSQKEIEEEILNSFQNVAEKEIQQLFYHKKYKVNYDTDITELASQIYLDSQKVI
jgi:cytidylate kinase